MMRIIGLVISVGLFLQTTLTAQRAKQLEYFEQQLAACQIEWLRPVESDYKVIGYPNNSFQDFDLAMKSNKEKLEIRYQLVPYQAEQPLADLPHLQFMRLLTHLATNNENTLTAIHQIPAATLENDFQADWGMYAFFQPKINFSDRKHCKLVGIYKEGIGMAYIYFLFNEPSLALDLRFHALQFIATLDGDTTN